MARHEGETGKGWESVLDYVDTSRPRMLVLENVPQLAQVSQSDDCIAASDADHIVGELAQRGYWATYIVFDAQDHGSFCHRKRAYFVAGLGAREAATGLFEQLVVSMKIGPGKADDFILTDELLSEVGDSGISVAPTPDHSAKGSKQDTIFAVAGDRNSLIVAHGRSKCCTCQVHLLTAGDWGVAFSLILACCRLSHSHGPGDISVCIPTIDSYHGFLCVYV